MKYFEFKKNDGNYYSKVTTSRGVYNYFMKLKNVSELYIKTEYNTSCIIGYNNIYNYLIRHYR